MSAKPIDTRDLSGRVVVVTGAGGGIGRELALQCAERGAHLALCDRNPTALEETARLCTARGTRPPLTDAVDVSDADQMTTFGKEVIATLGVPDLVINNAGIAVIGGLLDTTVADWERLVGVNVMGVVHGVNAFAPAMVERGSGHIVNLSSAAGLLANPQLGAYSATKFAVLGMTEALRMELAPHGVAVTAVCPGVINTAITRDSVYRGGNEEARRERTSATYAKRGYTPERAARNILKAVGAGKAVAPIAAEAHVMYVLSRLAPPAARWASAALAKVAE